MKDSHKRISSQKYAIAIDLNIFQELHYNE